MRRLARTQLLLWLILLPLFLFSCREKTTRVDVALTIAGTNRTDIENLFSHFMDNPRRLEAALFLIANMPGKFSIDSLSVTGNSPYYNTLINYLDNHNGYGADGIYKTIDSLERIIGIPSVRAEYTTDLKTISAEYLAKRIDDSVSQWESSPWKEDVPFEDFLRFILPYRVYENWWEGTEYYYRSLLSDSVAVWSKFGMHSTADKIRSFVSEGFRQDAYFFKLYPYMYPTIFENTMKAKVGVCNDYNACIISALRAFCIPATINAIPYWGNSNASHYWTEVIGETIRGLYDNTQKDFHTIEDELINDTFWFKGGIIEDTTGIPAAVKLRKTRTVPKIYRKNYEIQEGSLALHTNEDIPDFFKDMTLEDVTAKKIVTTEITIKISKKENPDKKKYAYLCCYNPDNTSWEPVAWAEIKNGAATFQYIGINVVYMAALYVNGAVTPLGDPFIPEASGEVMYLKANRHKEEYAEILSKVPLRTNEAYYAMMMRGGRLLTANKPDLSDTSTVAIIDHIPYYTEEITLKNAQPARFAIYKIKKAPTRFVAEIEFIGLDDEGNEIKLEGKEIGNPCYSTFPRHGAFDGDRLTYAYFDFDKHNENFIGIDFGLPKNITRIIYCPRNDDNAIIPGEEYELFYWQDGWQSLGRQTGGNDRRLHFSNIPKGALLRVHNHTQGIENRPFTIKNGEQVWW